MAKQLFQRSKSTKNYLDDTTPLICVIEVAEKVQDHIEYTLKVHRGIYGEIFWTLQKRYTDFTALDAELRLSNILLPLPPKKAFGNMGREFVAERQQGLQTFMTAVLNRPILANTIAVKKFLDPDNYTQNFAELALQHVSMILRSEKQWEVVEPLPDIGWRLRKEYILLKPLDQPKKRLVLSWAEFGPDKYIPDKELAALMKVFQMVQHPHIPQAVLSTANENGGFIIRPFYEKGTLRDTLCKCKPKTHFLKKYGYVKAPMTLNIPTIKLIGRQILETLSFLHEKGLPYTHLHAGNVIFDGKNCGLLELENWLLGIPCYYRQYILQFKKIQTTELMDVYCFGQLLFEMTFGMELESDTCDDFPQACPAQLRSVLESILTTEACKNGLPSVQDLLMHPFFSDVTLPATDKPVLKIPSKLKECLKTAKEAMEARLVDEQKMIHKKKRLSKVKEYHMSAEEKKKRRKSKKKALEAQEEGSADITQMNGSANGDTKSEASKAKSEEPGNSNSQSVPAAPAPPPPPPGPAPPPPPPSAPAPPSTPTSPPPSSGRGALLSSITGFKKGGLKKAETIDKSAPKL